MGEEVTPFVTAHGVPAAPHEDQTDPLVLEALPRRRGAVTAGEHDGARPVGARDAVVPGTEALDPPVEPSRVDLDRAGHREEWLRC